MQLWSTGTIRTSCGELPKDKTTGLVFTKTVATGPGRTEPQTMLSGQTVNPTIGAAEKTAAKCGVVVAGNGMTQIAAKVTASFVNGRRQVGLKACPYSALTVMGSSMVFFLAALNSIQHQVDDLFDRYPTMAQVAVIQRSTKQSCEQLSDELVEHLDNSRSGLILIGCKQVQKCMHTGRITQCPGEPLSY